MVGWILGGAIGIVVDALIVRFVVEKLAAFKPGFGAAFTASFVANILT